MQKENVKILPAPLVLLICPIYCYDLLKCYKQRVSKFQHTHDSVSNFISRLRQKSSMNRRVLHSGVHFIEVHFGSKMCVFPRLIWKLFMDLSLQFIRLHNFTRFSSDFSRFFQKIFNTHSAFLLDQKDGQDKFKVIFPQKCQNFSVHK